MSDHLTPRETSRGNPSDLPETGHLDVSQRFARHDFPVELLINIFQLSIGEDDIIKQSVSHGSLNALCLSQVCSHWRSACIGNPRLWTTLTYLFDGVPDWAVNAIRERKRETREKLFNLYLEHAGTEPLHVTILQTERYHSKQPKAIEKESVTNLSSGDRAFLEKAILSHRGRFLSFYLDFEYLLIPDGGTPTGRESLRFDLMIELTVHGTEFRRETYHGPSKVDAPNLRKVNATGFLSLDNTFWLLTQPISSISIETTSVDDVFSMARFSDGSLSIKELVLSNIYGISVETLAEITEEIVFPSLRVLKFENLAYIYDDGEWGYVEEEEGIIPVLKVLNVPALEEISISSAYPSGQSWRHSAFLDLFQRSGCNTLQKIMLKRVKISDEELIEFLRLMPQLYSLTCWDVERFDPHRRTPLPLPTTTKLLATSLAVHDAGTALVPKLRLLELEGSFPFDDLVWIDVLETRGQKLDRMTLFVRDRNVDEEISRRMASIAACNGVYLTIDKTATRLPEREKSPILHYDPDAEEYY